MNLKALPPTSLRWWQLENRRGLALPRPPAGTVPLAPAPEAKP